MPRIGDLAPIGLCDGDDCPRAPADTARDAAVATLKGEVSVRAENLDDAERHDAHLKDTAAAGQCDFALDRTTRSRLRSGVLSRALIRPLAQRNRVEGLRRRSSRGILTVGR